MLVVAFLIACHSPKTVDWQPPLEIARGGGTKGPWRQNDSRFDYVDDPSVALAADGSAAVVWVDHRDKDVHFQWIAPDGARSAEVNVSGTPEVFSWLPRIVIADRDVFVAWQEIVFSGGSHGGEIFFARSRDGGATFAAPINLSNSIAGDGKARIDAKRWHNGSLDLARGDDGTLYLAWTDYDGALWFTSSADGAAFAKPAQVAGTRELPARAPTLAVARNGTVYLAWTVGENAAADIHVATRRPDVTVTNATSDGENDANVAAFDKPVVVARTPTYSDAPKLVVGGDILHVAFAETRGGPFEEARVMYARSVDGARTFTRPLAIGDGAFPSLAVDGANVVVVFERGKHELALARSSDGGAHFSPSPPWSPAAATHTAARPAAIRAT